MGKRITYQDIADRVGVSKSTVSLAFAIRRVIESNGRQGDGCSSGTRLLTRPGGAHARTRRTNSIGILLPQQLDRVLENPYYSLFLQGVGSVCQREADVAARAPAERVDAESDSTQLLTASSYAVSKKIVEKFSPSASRGVPTVMVDEDHDRFSSIGVRESDGTSQLMRHLLRLGHRVFAFVAIQTDKGDDVSTWRGSVHGLN